jgi:hypothetical protein
VCRSCPSLKRGLCPRIANIGIIGRFPLLERHGYLPSATSPVEPLQSPKCASKILLGTKRKAGHVKRTNFARDKCALCNHLNYDLLHARLSLPDSTHALRRFKILDPKGRDSAKRSSRPRKGTYPSPTLRYAAPDSEDELLVVAVAAATAAHFVLNVMTADEGSRPGKPGGSAKGKARNRNRGREATRSVCSPSKISPPLDYFCRAHTDGSVRPAKVPAVPGKEEFKDSSVAGHRRLPGTVSQCARQVP